MKRQLSYLGLGLVVFVCAASHAQAQNARERERPVLTLPERVAASGEVTISGVGEGPSIPDVETLVQYSDTIIEGRITKARSRLTENLLSIYTDLEVRISRAILSPGADGLPPTITVTILGGKMMFPKGTAEVVNTKFGSFPTVGETYVFFLISSEEHEGKYELVRASSEAAYRILGRKIVPAATSDYPLYELLLGERVLVFLEKIQDAVAQRKGQRRREQ